jgi:L-ascorbate metabolism protein UlaG (beta-lactamase superfamily)
MKRITVLLIFILMIAGKSIGQDLFEKDQIQTSQGSIVISFIGHGTLQIEFNKLVIQVDPWSKLANYDTLPKADIILITHQHGDHLDKTAITKASKPTTILIVTAAVDSILGSGTVMKNGERKSIANILIEAVPAYNTTAGREKFHPRGRDNGYVLTIGGKRIYIAGDTENIPEMASLFDIDIAFLPMNQPYTMTAEQLVQALGLIKPKIVYPYHFGDSDPEELRKLIDPSLNIELRIRKMK